MTNTLSSIADVAGSVPDGALVALGGAGLARKPMAALRALVAAGVSDLEVVSFLGSVDVELLLAAGAVRRLHTAGVALDGFGLAPSYRLARQEGSVDVVEWSEGTLCAAVEAAGRGVGSYPCATSPRSDIVASNPWLGAFADPHTGENTVYARALRPEVALLHAPAADALGNIYIEGDTGIDGLLARAAATTIVTVEEVVARPDPPRAAISRVWIDAVVAVPGGSHPTECHPHALVDLDVLSGWARSGGTDLDLLAAQR